MDVRAPAEFEKGHIPGAKNLPLFSDDERAEVGTTYKQVGRTAAVQLGLYLVGPKLARLGETLQEWSSQCPGQPLRIHCWRGGMRSGSMAWLAETLDLQTVVLEGGYKRYRRWVLELMEQPWPIHLLGGRTGTGKTDLLLELAERGVAVVDLEGLAHHRGSSFGGLGLPAQPSTEAFENRIAAVLNEQRAAPQIWLEAESSSGRADPTDSTEMQAAPLLITRTVEERLDQLVQVYGVQDPDALAEATQRIDAYLQRTKAALEAIAAATGGACAQMLDYYDRCYDHELERHGQEESRTEPERQDLAGLSAAAAADQLIGSGLAARSAKQHH